MIYDPILTAREQRKIKMVNYAKNYNVATIKANVPGFDKNLPHALLIISYFVKKAIWNDFSVLEWSFGADGVTVYVSVKDGVEFKKTACKWEETLPIGRLIDIDVTLKDTAYSLSRSTARKCFLCDNLAFVCGRNKTHTTSELLCYFLTTTETYLRPIIINCIKNAMQQELALEDKFGLVTLTSNGSHLDMDATLMKNAIESICTPLSQAFFIGLTATNLNTLMQKLIPIGFECENAMLQATNQKNAYKGFIFAGGLLLASVGYALGKGISYNEVSSICSQICSELPAPTKTFGYSAYKQGFGGIRENAKSGFLSVFKAEKELNVYSPHKVLANIVYNIEDSVLLKRAKTFERYNYFKNIIYNSTEETAKNVTDLCIKNNISVGGSADVYICALLLNEIKKHFAFKE